MEMFVHISVYNLSGFYWLCKLFGVQYNYRKGAQYAEARTQEENDEAQADQTDS